MDYKGTKTEANLLEAFAGESQARNKYTYYASQARKEGYNQIADFSKKQLTTKKNTQNSGSKLFMTTKFRRQLKTLKMQLQAKTTNGQKCTLNSLK